MQFSGAILYVKDVEASLRFYDKAFGLKTRFLSDTKAYGDLAIGDIICGFASLAQSKENFKGGVLATDPKKAPPAFEIGFSTQDVESVYKKAVKAGAVEVAPPKKKPWGQTVAFLRDLDGHLVELSTPWAPPA
jgi:lactoylglutathione lyase